MYNELVANIMSYQMRIFWFVVAAGLVAAAHAHAFDFFTKVPNDSCSTAVRANNCELFRCDNGYYQSCLPAKNSRKLDLSRGETNWLKIIKLLKTDESDNTGPSQTVPIPNDSCALAYMVSGCNYYRCDSGLFKKCKDGKRARPIAPRQWNETIQHYLSIEIIRTDPNSSLETAGKPCDKNP